MKQNSENMQKLNKTNNFIKKLGKIIQQYKQSFNFSEYKRNYDKEMFNKCSEMEYLAYEVYEIINASFNKVKVHTTNSFRCKSEERNEMRLNSPKRNSYLIKNTSMTFPCEEEKEWEAFQENTSSNRNSLSQEDIIDACENCHKSFTWHVWKHSCRMCGKLLCGKCCKYRDYLVGYSNKKVKMCKECYMDNSKARKKNEHNSE